MFKLSLLSYQMLLMFLGDEFFNGLDFETTLMTVKLFQALLGHR